MTDGPLTGQFARRNAISGPTYRSTMKPTSSSTAYAKGKNKRPAPSVSSDEDERKQGESKGESQDAKDKQRGKQQQQQLPLRTNSKQSKEVPKVSREFPATDVNRGEKDNMKKQQQQVQEGKQGRTARKVPSKIPNSLAVRDKKKEKGDKREDDWEDEEEIVCICETLFNPNSKTQEPVLGCDGECGMWYHRGCINEKRSFDHINDNLKKWVCPDCKKLGYEDVEKIVKRKKGVAVPVTKKAKKVA